MSFNYKVFLKLTYHAFFKSRGTHGRITFNRLKVLIFWYTVFLGHQAWTWFCFLLDELLYPAYRKQEVEEPIFVIGNYRSGSTLLQRLLSEDVENFTAYKTWELYLAPSITQRKLIHSASRFDRKWLGGFVRGLIDAYDQRLQGTVPMHKIGLFLHDEDEGVLLHNWTSWFMVYIFPFPELLPRYTYFDTELDEKDKKMVMDFYYRMVQRHVYYHGGKRYIAKNPASTPRIEGLREYFPDAKFIYLARNPVDMVASQTSYLSFCWNFFNDPLEPYPFRDMILELSRHWYDYPVSRLAEMPESEYLTFTYDDVVESLRPTVERIYAHFDLSINPRFDKILDDTVEYTKEYVSDHEYSLDEMGYTPKQIFHSFDGIFQHYRFPMMGKAMRRVKSLAKKKSMAGGIS
ncbi:sulfotransferase [Chloroflexota bacterium]